MLLEPPLSPFELVEAMREMRFERCLELEIKPPEEELTGGYIVGTMKRAMISAHIDPKRPQDLLTIFARFLQSPLGEKNFFSLRFFLTPAVLEQMTREEAA